MAAYLPTPAHLVQNEPRAYLPTPTHPMACIGAVSSLHGTPRGAPLEPSGRGHSRGARRGPQRRPRPARQHSAPRPLAQSASGHGTPCHRMPPPVASRPPPFAAGGGARAGHAAHGDGGSRWRILRVNKGFAHRATYPPPTPPAQSARQPTYLRPPRPHQMKFGTPTRASECNPAAAPVGRDMGLKQGESVIPRYF